MLENLIEIGKKDPFSLTITITIIGLVLVIVVAMISSLIKSIVKKGVKIKLFGQEIECADNEETKTDSKEPQNASDYDSGSFSNALAHIIDLSINEGYMGAQIRRELYDNQMSFIESKFESIKTTIFFEYVKNSKNAYTQLSEILLKHTFSPVIESLRKICIKDRLNEKPLLTILETNKSLIETSVQKSRNELIKHIQTQADKDLLLQCFDNQSSAIEQSVQDCIKNAYEEAVDSLGKLQKAHETFHAKVSELVKPFIKNEQDKLLWEISLPPNRIVGEI